MLKNFGKDRKVRENFFENGEGTNKLVTSGLHQYTTGSRIILFIELKDLKVLVEAHSLTENLFNLPQLLVI